MQQTTQIITGLELNRLGSLAFVLATELAVLNHTGRMLPLPHGLLTTAQMVGPLLGLLGYEFLIKARFRPPELVLAASVGRSPSTYGKMAIGQSILGSQRRDRATRHRFRGQGARLAAHRLRNVCGDMDGHGPGDNPCGQPPQPLYARYPLLPEPGSPGMVPTKPRCPPAIRWPESARATCGKTPGKSRTRWLRPR